MKRSVQEIVELLVFGLIALLIGTALLWLVGWMFDLVGVLFKFFAGLIWSLLRFIVPVAVVAAIVYGLVRLLQQQRERDAERDSRVSPAPTTPVSPRPDGNTPAGPTADPVAEPEASPETMPESDTRPASETTIEPGIEREAGPESVPGSQPTSSEVWAPPQPSPPAEPQSNWGPTEPHRPSELDHAESDRAESDRAEEENRPWGDEAVAGPFQQEGFDDERPDASSHDTVSREDADEGALEDTEEGTDGERRQ